ncbi:MAG: hypothetical protein BMS9Abin13_020 [Patescibacteria group bacterium]|nr:MAG: hypothetical protein BMS9Abin13_020 [Patescibacteria group bacterium]
MWNDWRWWLGLKPRCALQPADGFSITAIIPAYNEEASIEETVRSLQGQSIALDEIIVVDDCSTDGTGRVARSLGVTVIKTPRNQGTKARAQNFALNHVTSDLFVTVDADTIVAPDAIERSLPYFNDERTCSVCGFIIPQKITTLWERARFIEYLFGLMFFKSAQNNIGTVLVSSGCFALFRTEQVKRFGGFDPRTFAEDMDLTWTLLGEGSRVYYAPDVYCYPIDPPTRTIYVNQLDRWYRGFLQSIAVRHFRLGKNKKLGVLVYFYLLDFGVAPIATPLLVWFFTGSVTFALSAAVILGIAIVAISCVVKGLQLGMLVKALTSLPAYFLVRPVNMFVFWRAIWREWIKRDKLAVWNKGH